MAPIHGKDGWVGEGIGSTEMLRVLGWRIDSLGYGLVDASPLQNTWQALQAVPGQYAATGRIICDWDQASTPQNNLRGDAMGGDYVQLYLYVNNSNRFSLQAYIALLAEVNIGALVARVYDFTSRSNVSFS